MATINFTVEDHSIRVDNLIELAQGSNNFDTCAFTFDSSWDGFTLYASMYQNPKNVFKRPLDESNTCKIPVDVLQKSGWLYIGARGEKDDETIGTSIVVKLPVRDGAVNGNETGQEILGQSQYEYLLGQISELKDTKLDKTGITLGVHTDGLIYIFINEKPIGNGLLINSGNVEVADNITLADGIMTILALANEPTQTGDVLLIV